MAFINSTLERFFCFVFFLPVMIYNTSSRRNAPPRAAGNKVCAQSNNACSCPPALVCLFAKNMHDCLLTDWATKRCNCAQVGGGEVANNDLQSSMKNKVSLFAWLPPLQLNLTSPLMTPTCSNLGATDAWHYYHLKSLSSPRQLALAQNKLLSSLEVNAQIQIIHPHFEILNKAAVSQAEPVVITKLFPGKWWYDFHLV